MCGKHIKLSMYDNSTTISSPNYPNIPPPNSECFWHISTDPGERLCLDFRDVFDFTESPEYVLCVYCSLFLFILISNFSQAEIIMHVFSKNLPHTISLHLIDTN